MFNAMRHTQSILDYYYKTQEGATMDSEIVTIQIEVEVFYRRFASSYGDDADNHHGVLEVETIPVCADVQTTGLPDAVRQWAETEAMTVLSAKA